jgi:hypothetical protein
MQQALGTLRDIWGRSAALSRAVKTLWVPAVAAVVGVAAMRSAQMDEVARVLMENFQEIGHVSQSSFAVVAIILASFSIWFCGRSLTLAQPLGASDRRYGYFLALVPIALSTGYLTACFQMIARRMCEANLTDTFTFVVIALLLIVAAMMLAVTIGALLVGVAIEPRRGGTLDAPLTRLLFVSKPKPPRAPTGNALSFYLSLVDVLRWTLSYLGGYVHPLNFVAAIYGLETAAPAQGTRSDPAPMQTAPAPPPTSLWRAPSSAPVVTAAPAMPTGWLSAGARQGAWARPTYPPSNFPMGPALPSWLLEWGAYLSVSGITSLAIMLGHPFMLALMVLTFGVPPILLVAFVCFFFHVATWPEYIGSLAIVQLFVIALLLALGFLHYRRNLLAGLAIVGTLVAWLDLNDTHHIRTLATKPAAQGSLEQGFTAWLGARKDLDAYARYPVYVVAARGGGIYAAHHAAIFLARMQDICPAFAQHLFAISAVSGGSLGAGVFDALAKTSAANSATNDCREWSAPGLFEQQAHRILAQDFLSPTVSAALFPDLVLQLAPACITDRGPIPLCLRGFDRARALERGFEQAWPDPKSEQQGNKRPNPLAESFYALWSPAAATPALLLNTTDVATGGRLLISPFRTFALETAPAGAGERYVDSLLADAPDLDLRLSTAIGLSARFPLLTPAAWFRATSGPDAGRKKRLVDGGYFDNSGIATALDVIKVISRAANASGQAIDVRLIVLTGAPDPDEDAYSFGELFSMTRALLNTRSEHWRRLEELARAQIAADAGGVHLSMLYSVLDTGSYPLPLGWQLSERSRREIEKSVSVPADCTAAERAEAGPQSSSRQNGCTFTTIRRDLARPAK